MPRLLVVNGPNLDLLGTREPEVYGSTSLSELDELCRRWGAELGFDVETYQSNHEGALIDRLHAARTDADVLILNGGALTHYSYALHDALVAAGLPCVEVHISNIKQREPWRRISVTAPACVASIYGRGIDGYRWAMRHLHHRAAHPPTVLAYGNEGDHVGDLRLPEGTAPHPVAVLIHGGFWRQQWTRDLMDGVAVDLARRGVATWNVEYRRVGPGAGWPATLLDVAAAVDHVVDLADHSPLDTSRTAVIGHSAGGQLALWSAARAKLPTNAPGAGPRVRPGLAVGLAPVADLAAAEEAGLGDRAVTGFLRGTSHHDAKYRVASPMELLPLGVPQLLVHGDADDRVPLEQTRAYAEAARESGDDVTFLELDGVGHFDPIDPQHPAWTSTAEALADRLLR